MAKRHQNQLPIRDHNGSSRPVTSSPISCLDPFSVDTSPNQSAPFSVLTSSTGDPQFFSCKSPDAGQNTHTFPERWGGWEAPAVSQLIRIKGVFTRKFKRKFYPDSCDTASIANIHNGKPKGGGPGTCVKQPTTNHIQPKALKCNRKVTV